MIALAVILWVVSLGLSFVIAPGNRYIWVPDTVLLIGFWPLLIAHRSRWFWLAFGVLNMFIGICLITLTFMPDSEFARFDPRTLATKHHLAQYHEGFAWLSVGAVSAIIGLLLLFSGLTAWIVGKVRRKANSAN